jgi:hypothetical protein
MTKPTGTKKKGKPRDELAEAKRALSRATFAWMDVGAFAGDPLARGMTKILSALAHAASTGDLKAINAKGGPEKWAHAYAKKKYGESFPRRAEAARAFLASIDRVLEETTGLDSEDRASRLSEDVCHYLWWWGARAGLVGPRPLKHDAMVQSVASRLLRVLERSRPDAMAVGVEALMTWESTTRDKATSRLKYKDVPLRKNGSEVTKSK